MKKILYISPTNIGKRTGGGLASLAYYNAVNCLYPDQVDLVMPKEYCVGNYSSAIGVPNRSKKEIIIDGSLHRYKSFLNEYLFDNASLYDVCIINGGLYAGDMMDILHGYGLKIMVIHHNFEREYHMDNRSLLTLWGLTSFWVVKNERSAYLKADCNCFLTTDDAMKFEINYGRVSSHSFIIGVFEPNESPLPVVNNHREEKVVITGSLNSIQTIKGIKNFRENYSDILFKICPTWNLKLAGRDPQKESYKLMDINPNHIEVIPNPTNMDDITKGASVFICPTNVGGGLKLRLMDGLRQGIPILVHKVSSRGYDFLQKQPFFKVYSDKQSFEDGLNELLSYCNNAFNREEIQNKYYDYFSFNKGCIRLKKAMDFLRNS